MKQRKGILKVFGLIIGKQGDICEFYQKHIGKGDALQQAIFQNTKGWRDFFNLHYFVGAQGSGEIQYCQLRVLTV